MFKTTSVHGVSTFRFLWQTYDGVDLMIGFLNKSDEGWTLEAADERFASLSGRVFTHPKHALSALRAVA
jgi:hypothetical protein